ncbi:MAG: MBL fold metallo-hydrolase [Candidatus Krumholzibacteriia bacterium]
MSLRICHLASGSRGNATWVEADGVALLIDCGLSGRTLAQRLAARGLAARRIVAVLVTHEHHDHVAGLASFLAGRPATLHMTEGTLRGSRRLTGVSGRRVAVGAPLAVGGLAITAVAVSHDAREPVAYRIEGGGAAALFLTDLGSADGLPDRALSGLDYLLVEANHDERLLRDGPYPEPLKRRIAGERGHLSNAQCGELLARIVPLSPRLGRVTLGHLSTTNNDPDLALATVRQRLEARLGARSPLLLGVARQHEPGEVVAVGQPGSFMKEPG